MWAKRVRKVETLPRSLGLASLQRIYKFRRSSKKWTLFSSWYTPAFRSRAPSPAHKAHNEKPDSKKGAILESQLVLATTFTQYLSKQAIREGLFNFVFHVMGGCPKRTGGRAALSKLKTQKHFWLSLHAKKKMMKKKNGPGGDRTQHLRHLNDTHSSYTTWTCDLIRRLSFIYHGYSQCVRALKLKITITTIIIPW